MTVIRLRPPKKKKDDGKGKKKKPNPNHLVTHYQYVCVEWHVLTEPTKLDDPPFCSKCHMTTGVMNKYKFVRTVKRKLLKPKK